MRYRFYSQWGLDGSDIARIVAFCVSTFWIGLATMGGFSLLLTPTASSILPQLGASSRIIGVVLVGIVLAYGIAAFSGKAGVHIRIFSLKFPSSGIASSQIAVSSLDWFLAASVLYTLLPSGKPGFLPFVGIFVVAQLVGAISHVPGGVGVFESMVMVSLSSSIASDALFGALIAYRCIYYLVPLVFGLLAFIIRETFVQRKALRTGATNTVRVLTPFIPTLLSILVFIAGAILIFSGSTPSVSTRLVFINSFVSLPILEISHLAASLTGLTLLIIADALRRRIDGAYYLAMVLLIVGGILSLLKGFDWEEALVLGFVLMILIPSKKLFYRHAAMLSPAIGASWFVGVGTVLAVSVWLVIFSYKHVQYSNQLWWMFAFNWDVSRSLRAGLGVGLLSAVVAFPRLQTFPSRF